MAIEYNRTMKIRYEHDERLNQKKEAKLAQQLQKKGLNMIDSYWSAIPKYGYNSITKKTSRWGIYIDDELIFDTAYGSTAKEIVEGLSNKFDNVSRDEIITETTRKDWVKPVGNNLIPHFQDDYYNIPIYNVDNPSIFDFIKVTRDCRIELDNGVQLSIRLSNDYRGINLTFTTFWYCQSVQRKEEIEENMVKFPLEILGKVQSIVEKVLKTKQFGYDVENVDIDCNFKAITLNESKCTPDIVKMTREARKQ
jgi:hypothetical protein|tara:strand:+ start:106 stop:861 length:756 start_codon:yes stop_codon:yes gene_type:complete